MKSTATDSEIVDAVQQLVIARDLKAQARKEWQHACWQLDRCDGYTNGDGPCFQDPTAEQCEICKEKTPLWERYQKAAANSGAALRKVLRVGKRIDAR